MMISEGFYPVQETYENYLSGPPLKKSVNMHQSAFNAFCIESPQCCRQDGNNKSFCEFQDYCNHLYYIDDRCDCASAWKKTAGLVIPTSI